MTHRAFDGYTSTQTANGVDGYSTTIRSQNATGTNSRGGDLTLASGKGTARDGYVKIQAGTKDMLVIGSTGVTIDGYISLGTDLKVSGNLRVDGYSSVGSYSVIDGYLYTKSNAVVDGYHYTKSYSLVDGYQQIGTHLNLDGYEVTFDGYSLAPRIKQTDMPISGLDGYNMTIKAQSSTVSPAHGGNMVIQSGDGYNGDGYARDGYVQLYSGSTEQARIVPNKFYAIAGQRVNVSDVGTTPFNVPDGYYAIMVDTSAVAITLNLPVFAVRGDTFQVKDKSGNAATFNITIAGNGHDIDASSTATITNNYGSKTFTFNGTIWSLMAVV